MGELLAQLPEKIRKHLEGLLSSTELARTPQSLDTLAANWIAKKELFEAMAKNLSLETVERLETTDGRAALLLTYSGSLLGLGPVVENGRSLEYASIKLRSDIPEIVACENALVADAIAIDSSASFTNAPIKSTSALHRIAVCAPGVETEEQNKRIREAMIFLTNAFVKLNRRSFAPAAGSPEQFNLQSMTKYIAEKNSCAQKTARAVLSDFLVLVETGVLLGERVSLGRLGRMFLKLKPPRKPRVMKNRFTGREMTIPAKPERYDPRMQFSKNLKERAAQIAPEKPAQTGKKA